VGTRRSLNGRTHVHIARGGHFGKCFLVVICVLFVVLVIVVSTMCSCGVEWALNIRLAATSGERNDRWAFDDD